MEQDQRIKDLEVRIQSLESEVSILKTKIGERVTNGTVKKEKIIQSGTIMQQEFKASKKLPTKEVERLEVQKMDWEQLLLQVWLPRVFIFVFIIGVLWGLKAASDYGWVNDSVKVGLGYLTSIALLVIGYRQVTQKREVLGQVLLGGGISVLILTTFAMHSLYGMIGPTLSFILQMGWIVVAIWLTVRFKSQGLAVLSVVGGFLVPFLIESANPSIFVFVGYETMLFLVFLLLAIRERFQYLYVTAFLLLNATLLLFYGFSPSTDYDYLLATAIIIQHACIFYFFVSEKVYWKLQASVLFSSVLMTYWWVSSILTDVTITLYLLLAIAIYSVVIYLRKDNKERIEVFATNGLLYLFFLFFHVASEEFVGSLLLVQGVAAYYLASTYKSILNKVVAIFIFSIGTTLVLFLPIEDVWSTESFQWTVLLATFFIGLRIIWKEQKETSKVLTIGSLIFTFLTLVFVSQLTMAATKELMYETQTLWLSFTWIGLSIFAILLGILRRFNQAKYIGVGLLVLTLVKLVLLDLPFIPIQFRALLFIVLGIIGLTASRVFYRKK